MRCLAGIRLNRSTRTSRSSSSTRARRTAAPRRRAAGARVHEIPPEEFGHGRTRNVGPSLAGGETVVFTSQDAVAQTRLACAPRRAVRRGRTSRERTDASSLTRTPAAGALLPRLPLRPGTPGAAPEPGAELSIETTLFSNVNAAIPRASFERYRFRDDIP